ncbi:FAD dependent oxidoreductase [Streptomyces laurentii]|uniref:FAD dependent oxidoreductase n=1 Tax=Streptomyces laurentii TaxID=39478 RepID=A0A160NTN2_STRLU|nr:FAD dependent oxidoreductase [Streptomyces laurentii]
MSPRCVRAESDIVGRQDRPLRITVDGEPVDGIAGQTIAGVLLAAGRLAWRRGRSGAPRGVFCGIGVCFDCLVTVGDERDVRACRRRARDGDVVTTQTRQPVPDPLRDPETVSSPRPETVQDPAPETRENATSPGTEER